MKQYEHNSNTCAHWFAALAFVPLLFLPIGCASVSVKRGTESQVLEKPQKIYIQDFSVADGKWNVDREGAELAEFKKKTSEKLTEEILVRASKHLVPAMKDDKSATLPPQNAWLITGRFTRVNQGSRMLRAVVGFGAGGTKFETEVAVYDLRAGPNASPFLTFSTTGGSGAQQGAIFGGPIGAAPNAARGAASGVTDDTRRTARMITAAMSDYMYARGWVSEDQRQKAKYKDKE